MNEDIKKEITGKVVNENTTAKPPKEPMVMCSQATLSELVREIQKLPWITANPMIQYIQRNFTSVTD